MSVQLEAVYLEALLNANFPTYEFRGEKLRKTKPHQLILCLWGPPAHCAVHSGQTVLYICFTSLPQITLLIHICSVEATLHCSFYLVGLLIVCNTKRKWEMLLQLSDFSTYKIFHNAMESMYVKGNKISNQLCILPSLIKATISTLT